MKLLLNVDYRDDTGKYWQESYIKNKIVEQSGTIKETVVKTLESEDFVTVSYKGKPKTPVYIDTKEGTKQVGWIFRVKSEIQTDGGWKIALFDAWVTVQLISDIDLED